MSLPKKSIEDLRKTNPTKLIDKQHLFAVLSTQLIWRAMRLDYMVAFGEAFRTPEQAELNAQSGAGIKNSLHCQRLAIDLILRTSTGVYLKNTPDYEPLGIYWEKLHPLCCWGGRFSDGNHFSITHGGRK